MTGSDAVLVRGLVKKYPLVKGYRELVRHPLRRTAVTALDGVDLRVPAGRCFCLLGPNGAGKTTLIKVLSTLVLPDAGEAFVNGHDVVRAPGQVKREIGYAVSEERSFYWRLSGRQNLLFFGALNDIPAAALRPKVESVLRLTGLAAAADHRFNTYSSGMRQMLAFARCLLTDARILFVDEPTRSLDPRAAARIRSFLRKDMVEREGRTVLWATHNLAEAAEVGHELAIIEKGRIRLGGAVEDLTGGGRRSLQAVYEDVIEAPPVSPDDGDALDGGGAG